MNSRDKAKKWMTSVMQNPYELTKENVDGLVAVIEELLDAQVSACAKAAADYVHSNEHLEIPNYHEIGKKMSKGIKKAVRNARLQSGNETDFITKSETSND